MDTIFEYFVERRNRVNWYVNAVAHEGQKFSDVYCVLFENSNLNPSIRSFLKALVTFKFNNNRIDGVHEARGVADQIYKYIGIQIPPNLDGMKEFLVYLIWVYPQIVSAYGKPTLSYRHRFDNIFAFMNGFEIQDTKVVIIGQDPSPICESTGYAYHGSICNATKNIINFLNMEFQIADSYNRGQHKLEISDLTLNTLKGHCKMDGWIKQGVLMFNTYLTLAYTPVTNRDPNFEKCWLLFTSFLVQKLCEIKTNLVFILTAGKAEDQFSQIIHDANRNDNKKHAVFCVMYPSHEKALWDGKKPFAKWQSKHWNVDLPFLNTNFYLYQLHNVWGEMIDWHNVSSEANMENQMESRRRFETWKEFFDKLLALANQLQEGRTVTTEKFLFSEVLKVFELKRNSTTDFYEMRCINSATAHTRQRSMKT